MSAVAGRRRDGRQLVVDDSTPTGPTQSGVLYSGSWTCEGKRRARSARAVAQRCLPIEPQGIARGKKGRWEPSDTVGSDGKRGRHPPMTCPPAGGTGERHRHQTMWACPPPRAAQRQPPVHDTWDTALSAAVPAEMDGTGGGGAAPPAPFGRAPHATVAFTAAARHGGRRQSRLPGSCQRALRGGGRDVKMETCRDFQVGNHDPCCADSNQLQYLLGSCVDTLLFGCRFEANGGRVTSSSQRLTRPLHQRQCSLSLPSPPAPPTANAPDPSLSLT